MAKDVWRAARKGDIKKIKKYIPASVKVDELDKEGRTSLHWSIEGDQPEVLQYLLDHGANVNLKDPKHQENPIIVSLKKVATVDKQEEMSIMLMKKDANLLAETKDHKSIDRILENLPKRFQVAWKEAYQKKYKVNRPAAASISTPTLGSINTQMSSISLSSSTPNANLNGSTNGNDQSSPTTTTSTTLNNSQSGQSSPNTYKSSIQPASFSPPMKSMAIGVISTASPPPITTASGKTYVRPVALDIVPRTVIGDDYVNVKDFKALWVEIAYKLSIVSICSEKIRYDDISRAMDECANVLAHFIPIIGDANNNSFMETAKNQDAVSTIADRVKNVRDGIKLRLFNRIEVSEVVRLVAALTGSLIWLYQCWNDTSIDQINASIAECALSCKLVMNAITYHTPVPNGILTNTAKLLKQISSRVFGCRSPALAKRISDSCLLVSRTFKSFLVLSILGESDSQKSPENLIALGKIIAEQLSSIKNTTSSMVQSKTSPLLDADIEREIIESAAKQLRGSIDFYKSNSGQQSSTPLPSEGTVIPLLASIQKSIQSLAIYSSNEHDLQMAIPAQMIAQDIHEIRNIFTAFLNDQSLNTLSEELNEQITTTLDCCLHFTIQLLFTVSSVICHNRVLDMSQIGYSVRGLSSCCCILLDSFCF